MLFEVKADLLEYPVQGIIHQCNCFHTMGAGLAKRIANKYPEAYDADLKTMLGDYKKLGEFSYTLTKDGKTVFNLYSQYRYGRDQRHTLYDSVCNGLVKVKSYAEEHKLETLGLPENMGCRLGGGSWRIVKAIIYDIFYDASIKLYICNYD